MMARILFLLAFILIATPAEAGHYKLCNGQLILKSKPCPILAPKFSAQDVTVAENAGPAVVTVTKSGANSQSSVVSYATSGGTAVAGVNYTPQSGSGTATVQRVGPDGNTLVNANTGLTAAGSNTADLPPGTYQVTISGSTTAVLWWELVRIHEE